MGMLFIYVAKSAFCITLFYLFYKLLLSRKTFHRFNRVVLLCILGMSVMLPFCQFTIDTPVQQVHSAIGNVELFIVQDTVTYSDNIVRDTGVAWGKLIVFFYCVGVAFFFLRSIYSLVLIYTLIRRGRVEKLENGVRLVTHNRTISPFSWMSYIVVSEATISENRDEILQHEMAHVKHCHSLDLCIAELFVIFQWFSPATWLLKQELQTIHEYEADSSVLQSGIDAKKYQLLLIKKAVGTLRFNSMTNSLNHSKLKKRITMMLRKKSNPWAKLRYLYILPLVAVAATTFANPKVSSSLDGNFSNEDNQNSLMYEENDNIYTSEELKDIGCKIQIGSDTLQINLVTYYSVDYVYCIKNQSRKEVAYVQVDTPKQTIYETDKFRVYAFPYSVDNKEMKIITYNKEEDKEWTLISKKENNYTALVTQVEAKPTHNGSVFSFNGKTNTIETNQSDKIGAIYINGKKSTLEDLRKVENNVESVWVKDGKDTPNGMELYVKTR